MKTSQKQAIKRLKLKVQRTTGKTVKRMYIVTNGVVTFV